MTTRHPFVDAYLGRLCAVASTLPPDRAGELIADITEHLDAALPAGASTEEVRRILEGLGTPEQLVAEAASDLPRMAPPDVAPADVRWDVAALVLLVVAPWMFFLPPLAVVAWLVGVSLLLMSRHWTPTDKVFGLLAALTPAIILLAGALSFSRSACTSTSVTTVEPSAGAASGVPASFPSPVSSTPVVVTEGCAEPRVGLAVDRPRRRPSCCCRSTRSFGWRCDCVASGCSERRHPVGCGRLASWFLSTSLT